MVGRLTKCSFGGLVDYSVNTWCSRLIRQLVGVWPFRRRVSGLLRFNRILSQPARNMRDPSAPPSSGSFLRGDLRKYGA